MKSTITEYVEGVHEQLRLTGQYWPLVKEMVQAESISYTEIAQVEEIIDQKLPELPVGERRSVVKKLMDAGVLERLEGKYVVSLEAMHFILIGETTFKHMAKTT